MNRLKHAIRVAKKMSNDRLASSTGFVYLVKCNEFYKIGVAASVPFRLSTMQVGCPYLLTLVTSWLCTDPGAEEDRLHELFSQYRVRGEWFKIPSETVELLAAYQDLQTFFDRR